MILRNVVEVIGENIKQQLRIGIGVDMTTCAFKHFFFEFGGIGEIAVMHQRHAVRRIDIKWLCLRDAGTARRRLTYVSHAGIAL